MSAQAPVDQAISSAPLAALLVAAPVVHDPVLASREFAALDAQIAANPALQPLAVLVTEPPVRAMLFGIFGASTYLTALIQRRPLLLQRLLELQLHSPDQTSVLADDLAHSTAAATTVPEAMQALRQFKQAVALLAAMLEVGGPATAPEAAAFLSACADHAVSAAVSFLFRQAQVRGDWLDLAPAAEQRSGYSVIAMGKHGAGELNYSSDIDLIIFFDPDQAQLNPKHDLQTFLVRLTRELVRLLQDRTEDGYVFRTDLRLRPDPGAMPVAVSRQTALNYYESVGQNWERAALIKARTIAGDRAAGDALLAELQPFIWRKYLDFAAIADIHAMKRQIHAVKGFGDIHVPGHNIKLGRGGIREIEFFVQTQQLIAGGRQIDLRDPTTLGALAKLAARGWITPHVRDQLDAAYHHLRKIEHRLQMLDDAQTQTLPEDPEGLTRLAHFSGDPNLACFSAALTKTLETVQDHYAQLFESSPELSSGQTNMVFAGEADDPGTLSALAVLGFKDPSAVVGLVRGWHHGRTPAVRTPRARELLTEVQPLLIAALAKTTDPQEAMLGFDRFLSELPSGVQLFSLLKQKPGLLDLIAALMGSAPRLARVLGKRRRVLDAVLDPGFFGALADRDALRGIVAEALASAPDLQMALDRTRVVGHEQGFLIGVRVLTGTIEAVAAGGAYAVLAEQIVVGLHARTADELARVHGSVVGGAAAVIAMGKLGGHEMTAASDLDLIVIYDFAPTTTLSDGVKPLAPSQYYNRFTQRLIAAFTAPTAEGALYEIDMRLRPSGQKGPVATQLTSFIEYQAKEAWTWEHMALTRARVIAGPPALARTIEAAIRATLTLPRDRAKIAADVRDMRQRIASEKPTTDIWDLKQVRGGLVDLEFITQHLQLIHASAHPEVLDQNTALALTKLANAGLLAPATADRLSAACTLLHSLTQVLRLCLDGPFVPRTAPDGLKRLLARAGQVPDFATLEAHLAATEADVVTLFDELVT